jgi:hypothetical protein
MLTSSNLPGRSTRLILLLWGNVCKTIGISDLPTLTRYWYFLAPLLLQLSASVHVRTYMKTAFDVYLFLLKGASDNFFGLSLLDYIQRMRPQRRRAAVHKAVRPPFRVRPAKTRKDRARINHGGSSRHRRPREPRPYHKPTPYVDHVSYWSLLSCWLAQ